MLITRKITFTQFILQFDISKVHNIYISMDCECFVVQLLEKSDSNIIIFVL